MMIIITIFNIIIILSFIDFLIHRQNIRQCHFPDDQNRAEDRYEEEAYSPNEEGQHVFQSLSPD